MRLAQAGTVALLFVFGCVRLGYEAASVPSELASDAGANDAASTPLIVPVRDDTAAGPGAAGAEASGTGPAKPTDAVFPDASQAVQDAGASDAATAPDSSDMPGDGAVEESPDAGTPDAGEIDAAVGDAAVGDAAVADAAVGGDASTDPAPVDYCPERADALFCDGFEASSSSAWAYSLGINGAAYRTTTRARTGTASLRASTTASATQNAARSGAKIFGHQKSGEIWARYHYYLPSSVVVNGTFSTGVVAELEPPYLGFALLVQPTRVSIGSLGTIYAGTEVFPRDRWTCVELHIQIDANAGVAEAYLDGVLAARASGINTLPAMGYTSLDVGIHYTDGVQGAVLAYVDDVVAGNVRAGCN